MDAKLDASARPSVGTGILMVLGTVPFIGLLLGLYHLLGIGMVYMGFLFLLYWMGILQQSMKDFVPSLLGGLGGIGLGWVLLGLPAIVGPAAMYGGAVLLAAMIFCFIRGQFRFVVNNGMMIYLTVATIPDIKVAQNAPEMAAALLVAAAYCFAFAQAINWFMARRQAGEPAPARA